MVTPTLVTNWGYQVLNANGLGLCAGISGTGISIDTTVYRDASSPQSLKADAASGATTLWYLTSGGIVVGRFYIRLASTTAYTDFHFYFSGAAATYLHTEASDKLCMHFYDGAEYGAVVSTTTITTGVWYRIDFKIDVSSTTHTIDWQIDGVTQPQSSTGGKTAGSVGSLGIGAPNGGVDNVKNFCHLVLSETAADYPIGPGIVQRLNPAGEGTHNAGTVIKDTSGNVIDGASYKASTLLDDASLDSTADYVQQDATGVGNYAEVTFADTLLTTIHGVSAILAYHAAGTSANRAKALIRDGNGAETTVWEGDMAQTSLFYKSAIVGVPTGGWTQEAVNALTGRVGYASDVDSVPYWDALILEVAGNNATISPSGLESETTLGTISNIGQIITPVLITGFEHGVLSTDGGGLFSSVSVAGSIQSIIKRSGSYALKVLTSSTSCVVQSKPWTPSTAFVGRIYFLFHSWPTAAIDFLQIYTVVGNNIYINLDPADHKIHFNAFNTASTDGLSLDTWYRLDLKVEGSKNPWTLTWQVDGVDQAGGTCGDPADTYDRMRFGNQTSGTQEVYYDDVVISATAADYPIGAGQVARSSPGGEGTHNSGTTIKDNAGNIIDGTTYKAYPLLDDVTLDATTDYVQQDGIGATNYAEISFASLPTAIKSVLGAQAILAYHASGATANSAETRIRDAGGSETTVYAGDMSETSVYYKSALIARPTGGWNLTAVNALTGRVGYASNVDTIPYWDALILEVATGELAADTTITASGLDATSDIAAPKFDLRYFEIYRSSDGSAWTLLTTTGASAFADTTTSASAYSYRVRQANSAGLVAWSAQLNMPALAADSQSITGIGYPSDLTLGGPSLGRGFGTVGFDTNPALGLAVLLNQNLITTFGLITQPEFGTPVLITQNVLQAIGLASGFETGTSALTSSLSIQVQNLDTNTTLGLANLATQSALQATGLPSTLDVGIPTLTTGLSIAAQGLDSKLAISNPVLSTTCSINAVGLPSDVTVGGPTLLAGLSLLASGVPNTPSLGQASLSGAYTLSVTGLASDLSLGLVSLARAISAAGLDTILTLGAAQTGYGILAPGHDPSLILGQASVSTSKVLAVTGLASEQVTGLATIVSGLSLVIQGYDSQLSLGQITISATRALGATGLATQPELGQANVSCVISSASLDALTRLGTPALTTGANITSAGLVSDLNYGPALVELQGLTLIGAWSIDSEFTCGSATLVSTRQITAIGLVTQPELGQDTLSSLNLIENTGLASGEGCGTLALTTSYSVTAPSLPTSTALGETNLMTGWIISWLGLAARDGIGELEVALTLFATGLSPLEGLGLPRLDLGINTTGLPTSANQGLAALFVGTNPEGYAVEPIFGRSTIAGGVVPGTVNLTLAQRTLTLTLDDRNLTLHLARRAWNLTLRRKP